jgi:hypothetical protein
MSCLSFGRGYVARIAKIATILKSVELESRLVVAEDWGRKGCVGGGGE